MYDASAPLEEDTDDEMPLLEHHWDDDHPPIHSLPAHALSSSMECLSSLTDPVRAYFFPTASGKPRSKSASHVERSPLCSTKTCRESIELLQAPPPSAQANGETKRASLRAVREKRQTAYLLASQAKREGQHRHQLELFRGLSGRDGERSQLPRREKRQINDAEMEKLLAPVQSKLNRLRTTTIPPYNSRINVKYGAQVLKDRLLPVGKHVLALLQREREERRGALEIEICKHIADTYWPSEVVEVSHLRVMEIYRNAVFYEEMEVEPCFGEEVKGG
ncbi:Pyruvate kinase [Ascochyta rabiei]|uniref:Uncharacterized protein n=1 Tax=Didymella rabiei TaxID=5454 RepID=A0A163IH73_DIDRA|nr:Pyruvate kinase [Ascochyta rabiei]KZM25760.1 hypothetical protein ST47_g3033 [Ascochyta rabiei]UPX12030.1 Pyruvate kinase [Ascochyta rabiei]